MAQALRGRDIVIDSYTRQWDEALRPAPVRDGAQVWVNDEADMRQLDAFERHLHRAGQMLEFGQADGEWAVYQVVENPERGDDDWMAEAELARRAVRS